MESDTLIGTSPLKQETELKVTSEINSSNDYIKPLLTEAQLFKRDVRNNLNPNLRHAHGILLAVPLTWLNVLLNLSESHDSNLRFHASQLMEQAACILFPPISSTHFIFNIQTIFSVDPATDFLLWFDIFQLLLLVSIQLDKIEFLKKSIYSYLIRQNINSIPFMLISCRKKITLSQIRKIYGRIRSSIVSRPPFASPLFTVHLQDVSSPYLLLWMDTENLCSFNLENLNSINSRINFANTLIQFINYAKAEVT